jgi:diguanylate cyclase (GGDEF)-like protein
MTIASILPVAFVLAGLLALGFHRQRAAFVLALGAVYAAGLLSADARLVEAALRAVPPLMLGVVLLPELRLLARRNLAFYALAALLAALAIGAPPHVHASLMRTLGWLVGGLPPAAGAVLLLLAAATASLIRWALRGGALELGLALACVALAVAAAPVPPASPVVALATACTIGVLATLAAGYRMAFIDPLSGLPNRRALDEALARLSGDYALAMVDIDHFKGFNDDHGHDAGDVVLAAVGRLLRRHAGGRAFRYGGEEFCIVYDGRAVEQAGRGCEQARAALESSDIRLPQQPKNARARGKPRPQSVRVTASFGLARRTPERRLAADVLKAADQALYKAKGKGRNRVVGS